MRSLFIFIVLFSLNASAQSFIEVNGTAEKQVAADYMTVRLNLTHEDKSPQICQEELLAKTKKVLSLLREWKGLSKLHSMHIDIQKKSQHEGEGFRARKEISFQLEDMKQYEALILKLIDAGVDQYYAGGFGLNNEDKLENELLALAMQDARQKAEILAAQSGKKLGEVLQISEEGLGNGGPRPYADSYKLSSSQPVLAETVVSLYQRVVVRFALISPK